MPSLGMEQAWLLPLFPAVSFVVLTLVGKYLPRKGDFLAVLAIVGAFILFWPVLADLLNAMVGGQLQAPGRSGITWLEIPSAGFVLRVGFFVDQLAAVMLFVVTFVGSLIFIYATSYMRDHEGHEGPRYGWFFAVLSLFVASMATLVLADNFLLLYITWELVGICSFLLIGFYIDRRSAVEAAKKAFVTTRIGDVGFLIGIIMFWRATGTFDIQDTIHAVEAGQLSGGYLTAATLFLFMGAVGKSAQFPLHVWLPDAMEGPTPVSALIHAATMVVAGVYMVARVLPIFEAAQGAITVLALIALITTIMSATMGLVMTDIKRVIAYSTINSLGLMFLALSAGSVTAALLYLFAHGFFKALLFLASGSVLHATGEIDAERLGGLRSKMPVTAWTFLVGALSMAGIIPLAGFWAKDEILLSLLHTQHIILFLITFATVVISALYMARIFILTFLGEPRDRHIYEHAHESGSVITVPLIVLAIASTLGGLVLVRGLMQSLGFPGSFGEFVFSPTHGPEPFHIAPGLFIASVLAAVLGFAGGFYFWWPTTARAQQVTTTVPALYRLLRNKYYMDDAYQWLIDRIVLVVAAVIAWFDRNVVNDTGVDGTAALTNYSGFRLKFLQTGRLPNYALIIIIGILTFAIIALSTRG